jgi:hypothetical protein
MVMGRVREMATLDCPVSASLIALACWAQKQEQPVRKPVSLLVTKPVAKLPEQGFSALETVTKPVMKPPRKPKQEARARGRRSGSGKAQKPTRRDIGACKTGPELSREGPRRTREVLGRNQAQVSRGNGIGSDDG